MIKTFKTMKLLKGVFKPLECKIFLGKTCNIPFGFYNYHHLFVTSDVQWKDKYDTPRYEGPPYIGINLFKYSLIFYWEPYIHQWDDLDQYWEQALWYLYYTNTISQGLNDKPDIQKAKESWPWQDMQGNSTWSDKFLIK